MKQNGIGNRGDAQNTRGDNKNSCSLTTLIGQLSTEKSNRTYITVLNNLF